MVDTTRTINDMQLLLADNTSGDIDPQDLRDLMATLCSLDLDRSEFTAGGWTDLIGAFTAGDKPALSPPVLTQWGGSTIYAWAFAVGQQVFIQYQIPHSFRVGSVFYPHIHWSPITTIPAGETVVWNIDWMAAPSVPSAPVLFPHASVVTTPLTHTAPAGGTPADSHIATDVVTPITLPGAEPDTIIIARVYRAAGTFAGSVFGLALNAKHQVDRLSTVNREKPYY